MTVKCATCLQLEHSIDEDYYCEKGHFCEVIDLKFKCKQDVIDYITDDRYCEDHIPFDWDNVIDGAGLEILGGNNA